MINLSVNVNKIATLRNARGGNMPDVLQVAMDCERFGADGITVHPRPDERHIRRSDVYALRPLVRTEFNIEGYPSEQFMELVLGVRPTQVTLNHVFKLFIVKLHNSRNIVFQEAEKIIIPYDAVLDYFSQTCRNFSSR